MGEVYRARDGTLQREVALKVLPELFAEDSDRLARFRREAQVLASLNHPNIAAIYGFEASIGVHALVLELVEGPTLADRIAQGPIAIDEALPLARQIVEALEAAHELGIVHRDLKPANIKLRPDGTVKVLDFGLAKLVEPASEGPAVRPVGATASPTMISPALMTGVGILIGTPAYMSPEQAKGRAADKRSDVWSFGAVLYEMLTGRRAFEGEDVSDTLANVLKAEPNWSRLPEATPSAVRRLLHRSLEKDRKRRLPDIAVARLEIDDAAIAVSGGAEVHVPPAPPIPRWRNPMLAAAVVIVGLAAGYAGLLLRPPPNRAITRFVETLPETVGFTGNPNFHRIAVSPDGNRLVYAGNTGLYSRTLDDLDAAPVAGTATGRRSPFFSPDGQWIGFWEAGQLKKVSVSGGAPLVLCEVVSPWGVTWSTDNTILIGQGPAGIWRVSGDGGTPERIIAVEDGQSAAAPQLLPDGRTVLFTLAGSGNWNEAHLVVQSLGDGARQTLITGTDGRYLHSGHLVYALRGTVLAVPFDVSALKTIGGPVSLLEEVWQGQASGAAQFAVASAGTLVYVPADTAAPQSRRTLVWVDRRGTEAPLPAGPRAYVYPRLSPDGTRLALDIASDNRDIWVWRLPLGPLERLTSDPAVDRQPLWTLDSQRIIFSSDRAGAANLFWQAANATGMPERLTTGPDSRFAHAVSPDGRQVIVRQNTAGGSGIDLMILDLADAPRAETRPLVQTPAVEYNAEISPDGRWLAYQSNASNAFEVYVRPFPEVTRDLRQVSSAGGTEPLWGPDGRELFYRAPDGAVMGVSITAGPTWAASSPARIIESSSHALGGSGELEAFPYRNCTTSLVTAGAF